MHANSVRTTATAGSIAKYEDTHVLPWEAVRCVSGSCCRRPRAPQGSSVVSCVCFSCLFVPTWCSACDEIAGMHLQVAATVRSMGFHAVHEVIIGKAIRHARKQTKTQENEWDKQERRERGCVSRYVCTVRSISSCTQRQPDCVTPAQIPTS